MIASKRKKYLRETFEEQLPSYSFRVGRYFKEDGILMIIQLHSSFKIEGNTF